MLRTVRNWLRFHRPTQFRAIEAFERHEPEALAGFDIERYRPELVCIEAGRTTRARLLAYFNRHGYERIEGYLAHDSLNWYFRPAKKKRVED